jgi:hypothetical protein
MSKTPKITVMMILVLAGLAVAGPTWWLAGQGDAAPELVLYGNVDLRQWRSLSTTVSGSRPSSRA